MTDEISLQLKPSLLTRVLVPVSGHVQLPASVIAESFSCASIKIYFRLLLTHLLPQSL